MKTRPGISLLEILATVVVLGIMAVIIVPRVSTSNTTTKKNACSVLKGNIEAQTQLWYRAKGTWPNSNLSDISGNTTYFPAGAPVCPVDGSAYTIDATTHKVLGHTH